MIYPAKFGIRPPGAQIDSIVIENPFIIIIIRVMCWRGGSFNYRLRELAITWKSADAYDLETNGTFLINCERAIYLPATWKCLTRAHVPEQSPVGAGGGSRKYAQGAAPKYRPLT